MKQPLKAHADNTGITWLESLLLCAVLGLMVLRLTIVETPGVDAAGSQMMFSSENVTLLLSTCVLMCALGWLLAGVLAGRLRWRRTWFALAIGVFIVAGIIAACFASDKRAALTDLTQLAAPMVAAIMLVQWLRSASLIRLSLLLVIAIGAAATVQCLEQKIDSNEMVVKEYESDPAGFLQRQGIQPGTMEHWMYEHRIYSKDIRGFLMTSNSTATFFLMAMFSVLGLGTCLLSRYLNKYHLSKKGIMYVCTMGFFVLGFIQVLLCILISYYISLVFMLLFVVICFRDYFQIKEDDENFDLKLEKEKQEKRKWVISIGFCNFIWGWLLTGLFLTESKGGIGAFLLSSLLLFFLLGFIKVIWACRRIFGVLLILLIVAAGALIVHYGVQHGRLPGGNSMLVRWQYWISTADMICDHALLGVGGGNFTEYYMHYKTPAALETVQNPHNWILSLLAQYGPLGLLAFLSGVFMVFFRGLQNCSSSNEHISPEQPSTGRLWIGLLLFSAALLLFVRPVLVDLEFFYQQPEVAAAAYLFLYLIPALVFVLVFILLRRATETTPSIALNEKRLSIALMCGLVAVLIHNLVDFAIFEPGNWSLFWLLAAIVIAHIHNTKDRKNDETVLNTPKRLGLSAGLLLVSIAYFAVVLMPPLRAEELFNQARKSTTNSKPLIEQAVAADTLSPKMPYQAANLLTQLCLNTTGSGQNMNLLDQAETFADIAIRRNPADFKPWRLRARMNVMRSEQTDGTAKQAALQKALEDLQQAIVRYPGSGKLHYLLANVAEQLGQNDIALSHYQTAVDIEDAYHAQFKIMYPDRETVISRLGETEYNEAKTKIEQLSAVPGKENTQ